MQENGLTSNRLIQMCVITDEGDRMNANWAKLLGFDYTGLAVYDDPGNNVPTWYRGEYNRTAGIASNSVDMVEDGKWLQFEVLEPKHGPSEWNDFMQLRRRGIHHIAFEVGDGEEALAQIEKHSGRKAVQKGATVMNPDCFYGYLDTKNGMGTTIELLGFGHTLDMVWHYRNLMTQMDLQGNMPDIPLAGKVPIAITMVCKDADEMAANYEKFLDQAPVYAEDIIDEVASVGAQSYRKLAFDVQTLNLEFLAPGETNTVWTDFQKKWIDGLFSMCYESADLNADIEKLRDFQLHPVQTGCYGDTEYAILDGTEDYGCMIEIRTSPEIREHLAKVGADRKARREKFGADLKYNEKTGIATIIEQPEVFAKLEAVIPFVAMVKEMAGKDKTVRRMPLGFVLRSNPAVTEDDIARAIHAINE